MNSEVHNRCVPSFGHFLEYLRLNKFGVGVSHYARVQQVLDHLGGDLRPDDPEYLKGFLCPIFASTEEEQRRFSKLYDDYVEYCRKTIKIWPKSGAIVGPPVGLVKPEARHGEPKGSRHIAASHTLGGWRTVIRRKLRPTAVAVIAFGVAGLGVIICLSVMNRRGEVGGALVPTPIPTATVTLVNVGTTSPTPTPSPLSTPTPEPRKPDPPPLFYLTVAGTLLLPFVLYTLLHSRLRALDRQRYENKKPPFKWPLRAPALAIRLYDSEEFRRAARLLRRRQVDEFFRLDIGATVSATIHSLGYPSFCYKPATRVPEYLALVERASTHDHQARLFDEMVKALRREGLVVTRYFYGEDPLVCCDEGGVNYVRLEKLKQRHAGHRLLLFGSGGQLLDPVTGRMAEWTGVFANWHERAVLTPESDWGWREHILSEMFVVAPADVRGLLTLVNHMESPASRASSSWPPADPNPLPREAEGAATLDAVRDYLGPQFFQWLCACAVYTELRWELTLMLGSLPSAPEGVVNEDGLLRLSRLPWFRKGAISDQARARLIEALNPAWRDASRAAVVKLLEESPPPTDTFASDIYNLELALQRWLLLKDKASLRGLRGALKRLPSRQVLRSKVLGNFLKAVPHKFFGLRLPDIFYRRGIPALGLSTLVQAALALALIAAALAAIRSRAEDVPLWAYKPFINVAPTPPPTPLPLATPTPEVYPTVSPEPSTKPTKTPTATPRPRPTEIIIPAPTTIPTPTPTIDDVPPPQPTAAQAAAVAGGQSATWALQGFSWTVPQRWRNTTAESTSFVWRSPGSTDAAFLIVNVSPMSADFPVDISLKASYAAAEQRKKNGEVDEVRWLKLDGVKGIIFREAEPEDSSNPQRLQWLGYRTYQGKPQFINIMLSSQGKYFEKYKDAMYGILYSTKMTK
jgi:hypothetical protein